MRLAAILAMPVLLAAQAAPAQNRPATSAYTNLDVERCAVLSRIEEGASIVWRCPGLGRTPLIVATGDDRFDIDAGVDNDVWESPSRFSSPGPRVEWRLRGGRPFAIIYRMRLSGAEAPESSVLGVETIGRPGAPGCVVAWIDGRLPNANLLARARADARAASFRCGRDTAEQHGPAQ